MATVRLIPPNGAATTSKVNGRSYTCAAGATIDVPDFDALSLTAQGWLTTGTAVGATSARPTANVGVGAQFLDTTIGAMIVCCGRTASGAPIWSHHLNGSSV
jgi:hypothetical protein